MYIQYFMYIFLYKIFVKNISRTIHIINTKIYRFVIF